MPTVKDFITENGCIPSPIFQSIFVAFIEILRSNYADENTFNEQLYSLGLKIGEAVYFDLLSYLPKFNAKHIKEFLRSIYAGITGNLNPLVKEDENKFLIVEDNCPICKNMKAITSKGLKICNFIPGIIDQIMEMSGIKTKSWELNCMGVGDSQCIFEIKIIK